ncbi:MAG: Ig-like domain-containing protein [Bacilli bacterium]|jgi:hypothetical protein
MKKKAFLSIVLIVALSSCNPSDSSSVSSSEGSDFPNWNGESIIYSAQNISLFGSGTPSGIATYDSDDDKVVIWNTDASLDNYGGVQTPMLLLDFSKAVVFEMDVISCYSEYIVKLAVEGVNETFYVLADDGDTGLISINVVDSMLSEKFATRRASPDPGYENGWWFDGMSKRCSFHILAKGPDGERQTAELVLGHLSIYNNMTAVTGVEISSSEIVSGTIAKLKGSQNITLTGSVSPSSIENQTLLWSSSNPDIASIDEFGSLSFSDVGKAVISAKSKIDQSKTTSVIVNVLSGFENPAALKNELISLAYGGSNTDVERFRDLFATTWGDNILQTTSAEAMTALKVHEYAGKKVYENYFDGGNSAHVLEAQNHRAGDIASFNLYLSGVTNANVYRLIDGQLYQSTYSASLKAKYAFYTSTWAYVNKYAEQSIVVTSLGDVYKYEFDVFPSLIIGQYSPSDFVSGGEWIIPDRSKKAEDSIAHALSPASIHVEGDVLVMKQNKYPEAKYCFGGIISKTYAIQASQEMTMLFDVASLNEKSPYVKTMWELKIIYYDELGSTAINSNPLKVASDNVAGFHSVTFTPAYRHFRIYMVVNGSDIGEQFPDAEMRIRSFKMYALR